MSDLLNQLNQASPVALAQQVVRDEGMAAHPLGQAVFDQFDASGVRFVSSDPKVTRQYARAVAKLAACVLPSPEGTPMLIEGGVYQGCWLESTGTINAELLSRFCPDLATQTFELFARHARPDGLIPYKILPTGPAYRQIQMVTPLARSVWNHAALHGLGAEFLDPLYRAMAAHDAWLVRHRDTRGSGGVEAFCTFDTGHDQSSRFWHASDICYGGDPAAWDPDSPNLPYLAPDLTANVACQRDYLAKMAQVLGHPAEAGPWRSRADRSRQVLFDRCWDEADGLFYDEDRHGRPVKVASDVLLRVLACEVGDGALFARACREQLLNTRKFFARYPFTAVALDDPRFDPSSAYNTWAGVTNVLTVIRAAHAFEPHGRITEQWLAAKPLLSAFLRMERFGQCINPWTGDEGYTDTYSPAILGLLDFVERFAGIRPSPGKLHFSAQAVAADSHGPSPADASAYQRKVGSRVFTLETREGRSRAYRDGELLFECPAGLRVVTDREGTVESVQGMVPRTVEGPFWMPGGEATCRVAGNQLWRVVNRLLVLDRDQGVILPGF